LKELKTMKYRQKWDTLIAEKVTAGVDPSAAARQVNRENPGLRAAMLEEHNELHGCSYGAGRFHAEATMAKGVEFADARVPQSVN
jgi:hypothetical protein